MAKLRNYLVNLHSYIGASVLRLSIWFAHSSRGSPAATRDAILATRKAWEQTTKQNWPDAIHLAKMAIAADPHFSEAYRILGFAYMKSGDIARAREALQEGSRLNPTGAEFAAYLGEIEFGLKRWAEAEAAYRRALLLDPNQPDWLLNLALAVKAQGRLEEAGSLLEKACELDPGHIRVLTTLGAMRLDMDDLQGAELALTEAIAGDPGFAPAHYYLSVTRAKEQKWRESLAEARKAVELRPEDAVYREYLGQLELHAAEEDFPEAQ